MSFSNFLEAAVLNHVFRNVAYTPPATVFLALFTTAPDFETGTGGVEVSTAGTAYARVAITFGAASGGQVQNSAQVAFAQATANWGTIVAAGIYDASTAGNLLAGNTITNVIINTSDTLTFPVGNITEALN